MIYLMPSTPYEKKEIETNFDKKYHRRCTKAEKMVLGLAIDSFCQI